MPISPETTGCDMKSGRSSSRSISLDRSAARPGSVAWIIARRCWRSRPLSSSRSSSRGDSAFQRSPSMIRGSVLQRGEQVQARLLPVAAYAAFGALEQGGDLGFGKSGEIAQFHDLRELGVDVRESGKGNVQAEQLVVDAHAAA